MKNRILLIDDDENFYNSLRLMLRPHPIEIEWAATGAMGIQAYRKNIHGFAVVLIDYVLPDFKGTDVAVHIRKLNPVQNYLFASGHRDPAYLLDQLKTGGARGFIEKGLSVEEVLSPILDSISHYENHNRVIGFDSYSPSQAELDLKSEGLISSSSRKSHLSYPRLGFISPDISAAWPRTPRSAPRSSRKSNTTPQPKARRRRRTRPQTKRRSKPSTGSPGPNSSHASFPST